MTIYWDDLLANKPAIKQATVWVCDCRGSIIKVSPTKEGLCPECSHYSWCEPEWNVKACTTKRGVNSHRKNTEGISKVKELRAKGMGMREISVMLGLSQSCISKYSRTK